VAAGGSVFTYIGPVEPGLGGDCRIWELQGECRGMLACLLACLLAFSQDISYLANLCSRDIFRLLKSRCLTSKTLLRVDYTLGLNGEEKEMGKPSEQNSKPGEPDTGRASIG
jgi:hypothetical protein